MPSPRLVLPVLLVIALAYVSACWIVIAGAQVKSSGVGANRALVVLGKKSRFGHVDEDFLARIHRFDQLLDEPLPRIAVATGGAMGGDISEAALVASHLPHRQVILEQSARSTRENLRLSHDLVQGQAMAVITSRYHLARTAAIARHRGLDVDLVAAEDTWKWSWANIRAVARESALYWPSRWGW